MGFVNQLITGWHHFAVSRTIEPSFWCVCHVPEGHERQSLCNAFGCAFTALLVNLWSVARRSQQVFPASYVSICLLTIYNRMVWCAFAQSQPIGFILGRGHFTRRLKEWLTLQIRSSVLEKSTVQHHKLAPKSPTSLKYQNWLVVLSMCFFPYGMSSFPLTFIFFRGVAQPPTSKAQLCGMFQDWIVWWASHINEFSTRQRNLPLQMVLRGWPCRTCPCFIVRCQNLLRYLRVVWRYKLPSHQ